MIPEHIANSIEEITHGYSLEKAVHALTRLYKSEGEIGALQTLEEHFAYLLCRMPATFAVNAAVFERVGAMQPKSMLDVGSGPGTAALSAMQYFPTICEATLIERDPLFIDIAKKLCKEYGFFTWKKLTDILAADLVLCSYMLSELAFDAVARLAKDLWAKTSQVLVLVETGTPKGYKYLMRARDALIEQGAYIVAPCPHRLACPIPEGDWCHFSTRIARSKRHRMLKGAELGYEDEKYCYLICSRVKKEQRAHRIVGAPQKRSGHVHLKLCTLSGTLEHITVSRKSKEAYKQAKDAEWGDASNSR